MEQQYLQFVLALTEAGLNPEAAKLGKIDTSRITDNYLQAGLNGGTVILTIRPMAKIWKPASPLSVLNFRMKAG